MHDTHHQQKYTIGHQHHQNSQVTYPQNQFHTGVGYSVLVCTQDRQPVPHILHHLAVVVHYQELKILNK